MWSLSKVHQVGELVAAAAVVVSLVFVGLQIRDNTIASEAATFQSVASDDLQLLLNISASPALSRAFDAYMWEPAIDLSDDELLQGQWHLLALLRHFENVYFQYERGMLSEDAWTARDQFLSNTVRSPGFQRLLSSGRYQNFSGPFRDYVAEIRRDRE